MLNYVNLITYFYLGGPCHPWLFIEEAAMTEVERDYSSVYSRLMLCKTYRLDEDGKVLTPEEVSYIFVSKYLTFNNNSKRHDFENYYLFLVKRQL